MKTLLSVAVASLSIAAVAADALPKVGVTEISATQKNTIVPVKYTSLASGAVRASDLVCTDELPALTQLFVFINDSYTAWSLTEKGGSWAQVPIANTSVDGIIPGTPAEGQTLAVGSAIWVVFPNDPEEGQKIYIYGQVASSTTWTVEHGKNNLITGNVATFVQGLKTNSILTRKDRIVPIKSTFAGSYVYDGTAWRWMKPDGSVVKDLSITGDTATAIGDAFWYYSAKSGTSTTFAVE